VAKVFPVHKSYRPAKCSRLVKKALPQDFFAVTRTGGQKHVATFSSQPSSRGSGYGNSLREDASAKNTKHLRPLVKIPPKYTTPQPAMQTNKAFSSQCERLVSYRKATSQIRLAEKPALSFQTGVSHTNRKDSVADREDSNMNEDSLLGYSEFLPVPESVLKEQNTLSGGSTYREEPYTHTTKHKLLRAVKSIANLPLADTLKSSKIQKGPALILTRKPTVPKIVPAGLPDMFLRKGSMLPELSKKLHVRSSALSQACTRFTSYVSEPYSYAGEEEINQLQEESEASGSNALSSVSTSSGSTQSIGNILLRGCKGGRKSSAQGGGSVRKKKVTLKKLNGCTQSAGLSKKSSSKAFNI